MASRRLRSLTAYRAQMERAGKFRLAVAAANHQETVASMGFAMPLVEGEAMMPPPDGPVADFNANGRLVVRKDLPKEKKSFMQYSSWEDWHGNPHSGIRVMTREVYQKEQVPPPEEYLSVCCGQNGSVVTTRLVSLATDGDDAVLHLVNLMLEVFGDFEVVYDNLEVANVPKITRLNWKVLPPGKYPFAKAKVALAETLSRLDEATCAVVTDRVRHITQHQPDFIAVGVGGFSDYMVFGFQERGVYVLESHRLDNATYVLKNDWEHVSQLTKKQILDGSLHKARVIHNHGWHTYVTRLIGNRAP